MKKTFATLCATAIAAPLALTAAPVLAQDASFSIQFGSQRDRMDDVRRDRFRERRAEQRRFYNGYRGYSQRRAGYRYHDGWWFPPAAFALGAIVGGAIASDNDRRYPDRRYPRYRDRGMTTAHVDWCYDRWRSYRSSDNSYQPYDGPRRQCVSPYS